MNTRRYVERDRIADFMQRHGYDFTSLSLALEYRDNWMESLLKTTRYIRSGFRTRFAAVFGIDEYNKIFGDDGKPLCAESHKYARQVFAQITVAKAIKRGELPHPTSLKCHGCNEQARQYHHESYELEDRLCVVPLCRSCHRQHHTGRKRLTFGVVPTSVGLVRIAIAGA